MKHRKTIYPLIILAMVAALAGCNKRAESSSAAGVEFKVDRLFTHEGCTIYRFHDGYSRYYARCEGTATSASTAWQEPCGKNCRRPAGVAGGAAQ